MSIQKKYLIGLLFIFSGVTSLVYESLWIRTLGLSLGSTSTSISLVLSIFFFGMSVGSYFSGRWVNSLSNPLRFYGFLEGFIGLYSFALIYALINLSSLVSYLPGSHSSSFIALLVKGLIVFVLLGPPTIAMGATLPLLIRTLSSSTSSVGKNVSVLYGINTLGAVLGALATGFYLIPGWGVLGSNHLMVAINILILIGCLLLSANSSFLKNHVQGNSKLKPITLDRTQWCILLSAGLVGLASIGSEVIWNKYLSLYLGTNIFGLSLVLAIFLLGIAVGSFALSFIIEKIQDKIRFYIILLTATLVSIVAATLALNGAPVIAHITTYYFPSFNLLTVKSLLVAAVLLVPTSLFGALLPLAVNIITVKNSDAPSITGQVYAFNTWGAILGSALTGLFFIPYFGSATSLLILNSVLLLALALVLWSQYQKSQRFFTPLALWSSVAILVFMIPSVNFENIIKSAYFSYIVPGQSFNQVTRFFSKDFEEIVFLAEGKTAIISLNHEAGSNGEINPNVLRMKTNGLNESYYDKDHLEVIPKYEALLGLVPFLYQENPQSAFIVGYGGGYTTDLLTSLPIKNVHVAEIEESVLKVADYIHDGNNPIVKRSNLNLEIEDARFVLNSKKHGKYDIIVSQPSHSWISGVANLFTHEFFEMAKSNLSETGVFAQWLNLYNMDEESLKSILSTYYKSFPYGAVYTDQEDYQVILLGSRKPLKLNWDRLRKMAGDRNWQHRLSFVPFQSPHDFLSNFSMGREEVVAATEGSPLNTDENAFAEIRQSRLFYSPESQEQKAQPFFSKYFDSHLSEVFGKVEDLSPENLHQLLKSYGRLQKYYKYFKLINVFEEKVENNDRFTVALAEACNGIEREYCAIESFQRSFDRKPSTQKLNTLLSTLNASGAFERSLQTLRSHRKLANRTSSCYEYESKINLNLKLPKAIQSHPDKLYSQCGDYAWPMLAQLNFQMGNLERSAGILQTLIETNPSNMKNLALMIQVQMALKDYSNAAHYSDLFNSKRTSEISRLKTLSSHYEKMGWKQDSELLEKKIRKM